MIGSLFHWSNSSKKIVKTALNNYLSWRGNVRDFIFFFHLQANKTTVKIPWAPINRFGRLDAQGTFTEPKPSITENFEACLVPVIKNIGEKSTMKNFYPVSPLSMVSKIFKKIVNNTCIDHLEKCAPFFWFLVWSHVLSINCRLSGRCIWWSF